MRHGTGVYILQLTTSTPSLWELLEIRSTVPQTARTSVTLTQDNQHPPKNKRYIDIAKRLQAIVEDDYRSPENYLRTLAYSFSMM